MASLVKVQAHNSETSALLAASKNISPDSPGYPTVSFHRFRLLMESGKNDEARTGIDRLLDQHKNILSASSANQYLALRMYLARNLGEFLQYAQRVPAIVTNTGDPLEFGGDLADFSSIPPPDTYWKDLTSRNTRFDLDAVVAFTEKIPTRILLQAARSEILPNHLRFEVASSAWVRAVLLNDERAGRELAPLVGSLSPDLKQPMDTYLNAPDACARKFAAVFTLLQFPGMHPYVRGGSPRGTFIGKIDEFRDNWWCDSRFSENSGYWEQRSYLYSLDPGSGNPRPPYPGWDPASPDFLGASERKEAAEQWRQLNLIPTAPNYLTQQVLAWAKAHPDDPRVPQALHLAIRSTRYGCVDPDTTILSKEAFLFLHRRYPQSEWTKKTKFWF